MKKNAYLKKSAAVVLSIAMAASWTPCRANAEISSSVKPSCDEAYYVMMDYYGNPTKSSIVKSYTLNGAKTVTDYGTYDSVSNLTDGTKPVSSDGKVTFSFDDKAPDHFYFEGKTDAPFSKLPWTISVSYKLNGVPKKAEDLAGEKGVVEMNVDVIPNKSASEYAQNNYTLEAAASFNQNDILSLEAPDAQIQTIGNIRMAAFIVMPGEEQHLKLRVGSDHFKFSGFTFIMGPVNSGRLSKITDLKNDKKDLEDSYNNLNDAVTEILNSMDNLKGSLNGAAEGLDDLNNVRGNVHSEKDTFYADFDAFLTSLSAVSTELDPVSGHISAANNVLTDFRQNLSDTNDALLKTSDDLKKTEKTLGELKHGMTSLKDTAEDLSYDFHDLKGDIETLQSLNSGTQSYVKKEIPTILTQMETLYKLWYAYYGKATPANATSYSSTGILATDSEGLPDGMVGYSAKGTAVWTTDNSSGYKTFPEFATQILMSKGATSDQAALFLAVWEHKDTLQSQTTTITTLNSGISNLLTDLHAVHESELFDFLYELGDDNLNALDNVDTLSKDAQNVITKLDAMEKTIDSYIPELQSSLDDAAALTESIQTSVDSLRKFMSFTESVMKKNSEDLNAGADKTLKNAADLLRKTSDTLNSTDKMRDAQNSIKDLIDKKWKKYTGEDSNIMNMDPDAPVVSLTSDQNQDISSVSVLIRTAEIKTDNSKTAQNSAAKKDSRTIGERIVQMFKDIWNTMTGWFKRK
jgi:putative membrane protein